jgi:hypothetical protein
MGDAASPGTGWGTGGGDVAGVGGAIGSGGALDPDAFWDAPAQGGAGGADVRDAAGSSPDAVADGTSDASKCVGFALQFGGFQGYVRVNRPVQDDFTLEAWIKPAAPGPGGTRYWEGSGLLWADVVGDANDFGASLVGTHFSFGVGSPTSQQTILSTTDVVTGSNWVHVAATRKRSTGLIQILINGVVESSATFGNDAGVSLDAQPNMTIGGNAGDGRYYAGLVDEVRAWNVVRTPAQITGNMHRRLVGNESGLVGYWRFDEGSGTVAADSSQSVDGAAMKNNGTLFPPINWVQSDAPFCP